MLEVELIQDLTPCCAPWWFCGPWCTLGWRGSTPNSHTAFDGCLQSWSIGLMFLHTVALPSLRICGSTNARQRRCNLLDQVTHNNQPTQCNFKLKTTRRTPFQGQCSELFSLRYLASQVILYQNIHAV